MTSTPGAAGASLRSQDIIPTLSRLMRLSGKPAYITLGSIWQNDFAENFNDKLRDIRT